MIRKVMLMTVGLLSAAVMLMGSPDSAWARRGCRTYNNYGYNGGGGYNNNGGGYYGGRWGRGRGGWGNANNGYYTTYNGDYNNGVYNNGMYTNMPADGATYSTSGTAGVMTSQPYETGYRPQATYDANGNVISNGVNTTTDANVNTGTTTGNQNLDRTINDSANGAINNATQNLPAAPATDKAPAPTTPAPTAPAPATP